MQASEQPTQLNSNPSLTTAQDAGRAISGTQPSPSPTLAPSTDPSQGSGGAQPGSSPGSVPSCGLGTKQSQDSSWGDAKNSPGLSVGQRMKKSQASWLSQPLSACSLTTSAPSPAAYALPQQAKRAATAEVHCAVLQKQCPPQPSGHLVSVPCTCTTATLSGYNLISCTMNEQAPSKLLCFAAITCVFVQHSSPAITPELGWCKHRYTSAAY